MVHPSVGLLGGMIALAYGAAAVAGPIDDGKHLELDFTKPGVAQQASWTQNARLKLGPDGLIFEAPPSWMVPFQLQTMPIAIGFYSWPARSAGIWATLNTTTLPGHLFARFSPDTKHWSTWQQISRPIPFGPTLPYEFSGVLGVPQQEYGEYAELCDEYGKLQPPGYVDEEACVQWIVNAQPDFFAKHLPFVGYVQFLYETDFLGGKRIERLDISIGYGIPGRLLGTQPDIPWRFRAQ